MSLGPSRNSPDAAHCRLDYKGGNSFERLCLEKRSQGKPVLTWPFRAVFFHVLLYRLRGHIGPQML